MLLSCLTLLLITRTVSAGFTTADSLAQSYQLSSSSVLSFPPKNLSSNDTTNFITSNWGLSRGEIQHLPEDLSFVEDPFPDSQIPSDSSSGKNTSAGRVLKVDYPANAFSANSSGAQFLSLFNGSQPFQTMLLAYDFAFGKDFNWTKGGKLPGIRGGKHGNGCFGGSLPNGTDCFSIRMEWRDEGKGEVNAFIPNPGTFCNSTGVHCTDGAGIDITPQSVVFQSGGWNRVSILVQLNDPPTTANGNLAVYYNDVPAYSQGNLQFRTSNDVNATSFVFSTFFGGDDSSWAPPSNQSAFFRNIQMWGGSSGSNSTGSSSTKSGSSKGSAVQTRQLNLLSFTGLAILSISALSLLV